MKPDFRFPKSARLLTSESFSSVFNQVSFKVSSKRILVLASDISSDQLSPRMGLIVAKKHVRLAVERNRLKRVARESFRCHRHQLPHLNLVVLYKAGAGAASNKEIQQDFTFIWRKLTKKAKQADAVAKQKRDDKNG